MKHTRKWLLRKLLEDAGNHGATTADLLNAGIGSRYGARILELREDGYTIRSVLERDGSYRYTLLDSPELTGASDEPRPETTPASARQASGVPVSLGDVERSAGDDVSRASTLSSPSVPLSACEDRLFDPPSEPTGHWRAA